MHKFQFIRKLIKKLTHFKSLHARNCRQVGTELQRLQIVFQVRLAALNVVQELTRKLGEEYLTLLPEIIPFLAELMEGKYFCFF
jgi:hypothetical protein